MLGALYRWTGNADQTRRDWLLTLWVVLALGMVLLALYASSQSQPLAVLGAGGAVAVASAMTGAVIGFLFGLPRAGKAGTGEAGQQGGGAPNGGTNQADIRPNTNLEDISDWLTKILVGVGLVQLGSMADGLQRLVNYVSGSLGSGPGAGPVGGALIVVYATAGFLLSFLFARTELPSAFREADRQRLARLAAPDVANTLLNIAKSTNADLASVPAGDGDKAGTPAQRP